MATGVVVRGIGGASGSVMELAGRLNGELLGPIYHCFGVTSYLLRMVGLFDRLGWFCGKLVRCHFVGRYSQAGYAANSIDANRPLIFSCDRHPWRGLDADSRRPSLRFDHDDHNVILDNDPLAFLACYDKHSCLPLSFV